MAYYNVAELVINDGTDIIDLLNNFNLAEWQPDVLKYRDGGIYQDSPLSDGRRLVQKYYGNLVESFTLMVRAGRMDSAISDLRRLRQMMESAASYWDEGSEQPVWLEARGTGETNRRYSIIIGWAQDKDPNPYGMPFAGQLENIGIIQLNLEHSFWTDKAPEGYSLTPVSAIVGLTGLLNDGWGNLDSTNERSEVTNGNCFVGNCDPAYRPGGPVGQISSAIFATSPEVFVSNAQPTPSVWPAPVQLIPNTMSAGDGLFFSATTDGLRGTFSIPFGSLVFDISTPGSGYTAAWYYSVTDGMGGHTWALLTVKDNTDGLMTSGVNFVSWDMPADWLAVDLFGDGVEAFWVKLGIESVTVPVGPYQQNRNIYTVNYPFVEVQQETIEGDIQAVMSFKTYNQTYFDPQTGDPEVVIAPNRMVVGLSSHYTDAIVGEFSPYLGLVGGEIPYNATSQSRNGAYGTAATQSFSDSPYQENLVYDPATDGATCTITIDPESAALGSPRTRYYGRFKAFLRYGQDGAAGAATTAYFTASVRVGGSTIAQVATGAPDRGTTDTIALPGVKNWSIAEFGAVDTRGAMKRNETGVSFFIDLTATADAITANAKLYLFDLILIPVEEWSADITVDPSVTFGMLTIDAILFPRRGLRGAAYVPGSGLYDVPDYSNFPVGTFIGNNTASITSSGVPILQKQSNQRLFFLTINQTTNNNDAPISYPWTVTEVGMYHYQRYHSMRGKS